MKLLMARMKGMLVCRCVRFGFRVVREYFRTKKWYSNPTPFMIVQKTKLQALKDKHKNEPCVCIGNGPSLNAMDFARFKDMVTIGCNAFYLKHESIGYVPTYYVIEDPLAVEDNKREIMALKDTTKVLPYEFRDLIEPDTNTIYVHFLRSYVPGHKPPFVSWLNASFPIFSTDFVNAAYVGGTVLYMSIQLAFHLGCNPIYLVGVDLSYKVPDSVVRSGRVLTLTEDDENHFDPRYHRKGKMLYPSDTEKMQRSFTKAYLECERANVELINAGIGGNLQVIPRSNIFY